MLKDKTTLLVFSFCLIKLTLHLIADANSGFQGDELLHIATGNHPDFGYMEFPPLIGWLAFIQNLFHSSSVFVHHLFAHLASLLILILVARITLELGGKIQAVFMVLLCLLVAPTFGRGHQLFQPVVFSQLFWVLSFLQVVRFVKTHDPTYLLYLSVSLAFGFLVKFDILFFIAGLASLLVFKQTQKAILTASVWKYMLVFGLLIGPNLWWQYQHQFPVLDMFSRLYQTQLDKLTIAGVLKELIISLNPVTSIIWVGGLFFMFNTKDKSFYRPIAVSIVLSIGLLALSKSKAYYFYPAMLTVLPFGSVWFEQKVLAIKPWVIYPAVSMLILSGIVLVPYGLTILPLPTFIQFADLQKKDGHYHIHYQEYYSQSKWHKTLTTIRSVYDSLPVTEKQNCLIWGKHYSQAGAVNLYGKKYGLPKSFSYHGSFYLWTPKEGQIPETIIGFTNGEAGIDFFQNFFNTVIPVKKVYNPYADFDKDLWQTIYLCKNPKQDFAALREEFRTRIFE